MRVKLVALMLFLIVVGAALFGWARNSAKKGAKSEVPNERELYDCIANYYRTPAPEAAPKMLEAYLATKPDPQNPNLPVPYFFARVAQLHPAANRGYEALFDRVSAPGKALVLMVLQLSADDKTVEFLRSKLKDKRCAPLWDDIGQAIRKGLPLKVTVLQRPVENSVDMDVRWAEFSVTGNPEVVVPIIDVLEWPDRLRQKLDDWLSARMGTVPTTAQREQVQRRLFETAGIVYDLTRREIKNAQDLDILCVLKEGVLSGDRLKEIRQGLPFPLKDEDLNYMVLKGVARWSLGSNAGQHPLVLLVCEAEAGRRPGHAKLALLEIIAQIHLSNRDYSMAARKIREYLELSPSNAEMKRQLRFAESELDLQALMGLSVSAAAREPEEVSEPKKIGLRCADETEKPPAYISELVLIDRTRKELASKDYIGLAWRLDFAKPDRYHVNQKGWGGQDYEYDEWVTIGSEHYNNVGLWVKWVDSGRIKLNSLLRVEKYLLLLRAQEPKSASVYHYRDRSYYVLEYESSDLGGFAAFSDLLIGPAHFRIWIDSETGLLAKGEFVARTKEPKGKEVPFELQQTFAGYGSEIHIEAPQVQVRAEGNK